MDDPHDRELRDAAEAVQLGLGETIRRFGLTPEEAIKLLEDELKQRRAQAQYVGECEISECGDPQVAPVYYITTLEGLVVKMEARICQKHYDQVAAGNHAGVSMSCKEAG